MIKVEYRSDCGLGWGWYWSVQGDDFWIGPFDNESAAHYDAFRASI